MSRYDSRLRTLELVAAKYNATSVDYSDRLAAAKRKATERLARLGLPQLEDSPKISALKRQHTEELRRVLA